MQSGKRKRLITYYFKVEKRCRIPTEKEDVYEYPIHRDGSLLDLANELIGRILFYLPIMDVVRMRAALVVNRSGNAMLRSMGLDKEAVMRKYIECTGISYKDMEVCLRLDIVARVKDHMHNCCERCGNMRRRSLRKCKWYGGRKTDRDDKTKRVCKQCAFDSWKEGIRSLGMMELNAYCLISSENPFEVIDTEKLRSFKVRGKTMQAIVL